MNYYQKLIGNSQIEECIAAFIELGGGVADKTILLSGRWKRNEEDNRRSVLYPQEYNTERNKIIEVLSGIAMEQKEPSNVNAVVKSNVSSEYTRENILALIKHFSRRNKEFKGRLEDHLGAYDSYQRELIDNPGYDASKRRYNSMKDTFEQDLKVALDLKADTFEEEIAQIQSYIKASVPTMDDLRSAFAIAAGLGFKNPEIEKLLQFEISTNENRIRIAEFFESFLKAL